MFARKAAAVAAQLLKTANSEEGRAIGASTLSAIKSIGVGISSGSLNQNMSAGEAYAYYMENIAPEVKQVANGMLSLGQGLDGAAILARLADGHKDTGRINPNEESITRAIGTSRYTVGARDTTDRSASVYLTDRAMKAKIALSVLSPSSLYQYQPDLDTHTPYRLVYDAGFYVFRTPHADVTLAENLFLVFQSPQTIFKHVQRRDGQSVQYAIDDITPNTVTPLLRLPAGTYFIEKTDYQGRFWNPVALTNTVTGSHSHATLFDGGAQMTGRKNGASIDSSDGCYVTHYVHTSPSTWTLNLNTSGTTMGQVRVLNCALANVSTSLGNGPNSTVAEWLAHDGMSAYSSIILAVQDALGDCMFEPTCLYERMNEFYIAEVRDTDAGNPSTLDPAYAYLSNYASERDQDGVTHTSTYTLPQIQLLYSHLVELIAIELDLMPTDLGAVNEVSNVHIAGRNAKNTSAVILL
jgi:hypothetical protein